MLKTLKSFDLKGKRVLIRVDFNVPVKNDLVVDDFRIKSALPTINFCLKAGAKVVLMSHLGRPEGKNLPELSLVPVGESLSDALEMPIKFSDNCISEDAHDVTLGLKSGEIHLLENLRFHNEETLNDKVFSAKLAKHGEIFINDAFGTAHRSHASNVGVANNFMHKGIGFLIEKELQFLSDVLIKPSGSLTVILGGAKIGTKIPLIERFMDVADNILIGGGMSFTFSRARGKNIGNSLVDDEMIVKAKNILSKDSLRNSLVFPKDFVCSKSIDEVKKISIHDNYSIPSDLMGLDIGPKTIEIYSKIISESQTVLWNGPMGVFEVSQFSKGTEAVANKLSSLAENGKTSIVGGGDSAAALKKFNLLDKMSHVSTGGGASLELLTKNTLPALYSMEV